LEALKESGLTTIRQFKRIDMEDVKNLMEAYRTKRKKEQEDLVTDVTVTSQKEEKKVDTKEKKLDTKEEKKADTKEEKKEEEKKEDLKVIRVCDAVILKEAFDKCTKIEDSAKFLRLDAELKPHLIKAGISEQGQIEIEKSGITTLQQFMVLTVDGLNTAFSKPRIKISLKDKTSLQRLNQIINSSVEEKELYE